MRWYCGKPAVCPRNTITFDFKGLNLYHKQCFKCVKCLCKLTADDAHQVSKRSFICKNPSPNCASKKFGVLQAAKSIIEFSHGSASGPGVTVWGVVLETKPLALCVIVPEGSADLLSDDEPWSESECEKDEG
eukprot:81121_1